MVYAVEMPSTELLDDPLLTSVPLTEGYKVLGGVALYQKLGQGGMGAVYKGRHVRLDIDVALKVMVPPAGISPERADIYVQRFIREARTAAKIDHPNLIRVTDVNAENGVYFLVMQFVDGESAAERLKRKGPLPEAEAVQIVLGAAEGLARAHQTGIVHRDVKPDNIMIDREGGVKVADLGLAKAFQQDDDGGQSMLTQTQHALGTPSYMPPEQFISARSVGPPGDVWALGITLFELLTGQLPWTGSSVFVVGQKITDEPLPELKALRPELSDTVCALIERATQKDSGKRFADCGQMATTLRNQQQSAAQPVVSLDDFSAEDLPRGAPQVSPPPENKLSSILVILEDQSVELTPAVASKSNAPLTETISIEEALRDRQVEDAVLDNNITTAVKRVRDLAGVTAVGAKAAVESLAEQLNAVSARAEVKVERSSSSALAPASVQPTPATVHPVARKSSAFSWVVPTILLLLLVATAWYLLGQLLQKQPRKAEERQIKTDKGAKQKAEEQTRSAEEDRKRREAEREREIQETQIKTDEGARKKATKKASAAEGKRKRREAKEKQLRAAEEERKRRKAERGRGKRRKPR